ncbi:MAG TPA: hypothetical protein PK590_00180 [Candidatus Omnitrophota bacterium]|nr:hypothetical protein [Candidatus Omnitrophota bacterium]
MQNKQTYPRIAIMGFMSRGGAKTGERLTKQEIWETNISLRMANSTQINL